ncbi:MAG: biopolymer transporter ExbD [Natronohydrobacter sp.]|nr:biopolymer transporter ExbD [Natronohydrobacter sp.]
MSALDFNLPARKPPRESVVPMINVVFLLLIFFLISAQIAPPDPVEITPPVADSEAPLPEAARVAWLDREGIVHFDGLSGDAAFARLTDAPGAVTLRADAALSAAEFAQILRTLGEAGLRDVTLVATAGTP